MAGGLIFFFNEHSLRGVPFYFLSSYPTFRSASGEIFCSHILQSKNQVGEKGMDGGEVGGGFLFLVGRTCQRMMASCLSLVFYFVLHEGGGDGTWTYCEKR
jgi:hypothetical protein